MKRRIPALLLVLALVACAAIGLSLLARSAAEFVSAAASAISAAPKGGRGGFYFL